MIVVRGAPEVFGALRAGALADRAAGLRAPLGPQRRFLSGTIPRVQELREELLGRRGSDEAEGAGLVLRLRCGDGLLFSCGVVLLSGCARKGGEEKKQDKREQLFNNIYM